MIWSCGMVTSNLGRNGLKSAQSSSTSRGPKIRSRIDDGTVWNSRSSCLPNSVTVKMTQFRSWKRTRGCSSDSEGKSAQESVLTEETIQMLEEVGFEWYLAQPQVGIKIPTLFAVKTRRQSKWKSSQARSLTCPLTWWWWKVIVKRGTCSLKLYKYMATLDACNTT